MGLEENVSWRQAIINGGIVYVLYLEDCALTVQQIPAGSRTDKAMIVKYFPKDGDKDGVETMIVKKHADGLHSFFMVANAELGRFYHSARDLEKLELHPLLAGGADWSNSLNSIRAVSNIISRTDYFGLESLPKEFKHTFLSMDIAIKPLLVREQNGEI